MKIPVRMTFSRDGGFVSAEYAEVKPEAVLDALVDVAEVVLNAWDRP